jgi:hypothetical protein
MAYPWVKLWTEFVHDPKMLLLPEHLQLVYVKLLCICGEYDQERKGWLPAPKRLAVTLRSTPEQVLADLNALAETDPDDPDDEPLVALCDGRWMITKFEARQGAMSSTARSTAMRGKKHRGAYYTGADATDTQRNVAPDATDVQRNVAPDATDVQRNVAPDATNRCTDLDIDVDIDTDVDTDVVVVPPPRATEQAPQRDALTAQFYDALSAAGVMVSSQAQAQAYNEVIEDIRGHPQADEFVRQLFAEAAATTSGRITPRWFEVVVDRCLREGRMPGDKRTVKGRDAPTSSTEHSLDEWAAIAAQFKGGRA